MRAGLTGDPRAAAVLERAGLAALRSGALATAVTRLDAAVSLAGEEASTRLLLAQGEALLAGSGPARAIEVYDRVLARPDIPADDRVTASWMLGKTRFLAGAHDAAAAAFDQAARLALPGAPGVAVEVLLDAAFSAWLTTGPGHALPLAARAVALAVPLEPHVRDRAQAEWGQIALQTGDPSGVDAAAAAAVGAGPGHGAGSAAPASQTQAAWDAASAFAGAACLVERTAESHASFTALRAAAEQAANPTAIAFLANKHAYTLTRMGRLEEAMAALDVALSLADVVPPMESFSGVGAAYIGLYMGRLDDSARWCERVEAGATARGEWNALLFLWDVLGHRRLREGAVTEACGYYERLEAAVRRMGIGEPCLPPWGRHGIGAYLAAGRQDDARRVIAWLDRSARRLPCRFPRIAAAAGRAQLAEQAGRRDEAEAHFRAALVLHEEVDLPLEKAETLLGYGSFLRRCGTLARARPVLAETMQVAEACKAGWLARLAHDELRIAGGRRRRGSSAALTAQEQRVADLAATGASNREIARQLYLSVSTIETHLERRLRQAGHPLPAPADRPGQRFGRFPDDTGSRPGPRCQ